MYTFSTRLTNGTSVLVLKKIELCESDSSYVMHFEMYSGKDFPVPGFDSVAYQVSCKTAEVWIVWKKKYQLFTDNFYNKIPLAEELLNTVYITGTIRKKFKRFTKSYN